MSKLIQLFKVDETTNSEYMKRNGKMIDLREFGRKYNIDTSLPTHENISYVKGYVQFTPIKVEETILDIS